MRKVMIILAVVAIAILAAGCASDAKVRNQLHSYGFRNCQVTKSAGGNPALALCNIGIEGQTCSVVVETDGSGHPTIDKRPTHCHA